VVHAQRDLEFRGSQPSRSSGEEKPPKTIQRTMDREKYLWRLRIFRGSLNSEGFRRLRGSQEAQREPTFRSRWERGIFQELRVRCHGLRRPDRRFKGKILTGVGCLLGWDHVR
jgi:hypothetical protein